MKSFFLNIAFFLFEIILLIILYIAITWVLDTFIFDLFNWFNRLDIILKIALLVIGGIGIIYLILGILQGVFLYLTQPIFNRLPINAFTDIVSYIAFGINTIVLLYNTWNVVESHTFWVEAELLILSIIIISLNWSLLVHRRENT